MENECENGECLAFPYVETIKHTDILIIGIDGRFPVFTLAEFTNLKQIATTAENSLSQLRRENRLCSPCPWKNDG